MLRLKKKPSQKTTKVAQRTPDYTSQMEILAIELALAGGQVLKEMFDFTPEQIAEWMDKTLTKAKENRNTMLSRIVEGIDKNE